MPLRFLSKWYWNSDPDLSQQRVLLSEEEGIDGLPEAICYNVNNNVNNDKNFYIEQSSSKKKM